MTAGALGAGAGLPSPAREPWSGARPVSGPALEVSALSKTFGSFRALDRVSFILAPGTVHALLGENGAGKSTLVKCIMGYHRADEGRIRLDGREVSPRNPREAQALGIGMIYQHFTVVPNMTVCENLVLARARLPIVFDWKREREALASFMGRMPFRIDLDALVRSLSAGERQKVEILKQLYLQSRIVILDEPTSVLTPLEADEVLTMLRDRARGGDVSLVIITHKFREVTRFADEVTVLRRGRVVGHARVSDTTTQSMAEMMMGAAPPAPPARSSASSVGDVRLHVEALEVDDDAGTPALRGLSLEVRAGEIVGVAAIAGNGQEELVEVLGGQRPKRAGRVVVAGKDFVPTRGELRARKLRCLPEEPLRSACVPTMSVAENMAFRTFDVPPFTVLRWLIARKAIEGAARAMVADYAIRAPSIHAPIGQLSGGNVQRAVLARELSGEVDVLVAANPCMGLDFVAVSEVHARIRQARDRGAAVLLVSADLDEILALAGRILVMSEGCIVHETTADEAEPARLGKYMAAHLATQESSGPSQ
jgi:general nucleoside transport system ATP-binding protein